jgi:hypothetical protein
VRYAIVGPTDARYCHVAPSAVGWAGVGVCCLRLGQLDDAREALAEANTHDNTNELVGHAPHSSFSLRLISSLACLIPPLTSDLGLSIGGVRSPQAAR